MDVKKSYFTERRNIGIMGIALPFLCWVSCLLIPDKDPDWWASMSATYHNSPVLSMGLAIVAMFLFSYRGYDLGDRIVNRISATAALVVALVPCKVAWLEYFGILHLTGDVTNAIHGTAAGILFASFIVNIVYNFTKGSDKIRNAYYIICGVLMGCTIITFLASSIYHKIFWMEVLELVLFGSAWLVKGHFLSKEE